MELSWCVIIPSLLSMQTVLTVEINLDYFIKIQRIRIIVLVFDYSSSKPEFDWAAFYTGLTFFLIKLTTT